MTITVALVASTAHSHIRFRGPLIKMMASSGRKVYALAADYTQECREEISSLGAEPVDISLARTGMNPLADIRDTVRLVRVLGRIAPDVVVCSFMKPVIYGMIAAWIARVPCRVAMIEGLGYVYTGSGNSTNIKKAALKILVSVLYRYSLRLANQVIYLNEDDRNDFSRWGIVQSEKAVVLGGIGVDLEEWSFVEPVIQPVRFIFVGRLLREKGIEHFLAAARRVKARHPSVEFVVLGDLDSNPGGVQATLMREWTEAGIGEWPGHVPVLPWLERSSVFVLPSYREGVPRSTQEAMALGRPVITTNAAGCRDTVDHGVNGYLIPLRDEVALATAMIRFVEQPELITRMGRESRRMAEERFNVHEVNRRLLGLLGL